MPKESTRKKNEEIPIIKPGDCPGALIKFMNRQRSADRDAMKEIIQKELEPVHQFAQMTANNRTYIQLLALVVAFSILAGCVYIFG